MTVRYSTNWMGPISTDWYRDRGLTKRATRVLERDSTVSDKKAGDIIEYDEVIEEYCAGRIDCTGPDLGRYGDEIGVPPMRSEDWVTFSNWLETVETDFMWNLKDLVELYERTSPKIRWWNE